MSSCSGHAASRQLFPFQQHHVMAGPGDFEAAEEVVGELQAGFQPQDLTVATRLRSMARGFGVGRL